MGSLSKDDEIELTVPTGAILRIVESYSSIFNTQYTITLPEGVTIPQSLTQDGQTCEIRVPSTEDTITEIVCTNTRIYTVKVRKVLDDQFIDSGTFTFKGTLTDSEGNELEPFKTEPEFEIKVDKGFGLITFTLPANTVFKVEEEQIPAWYTATYRIGTTTTFNSALPELTVQQTNDEQVIEVKNTRQTRDVEITKQLIEKGTGTKEFGFVATLYEPDGETLIPSYTLATGVITGAVPEDENAGTENVGKASFRLSPGYGSNDAGDDGTIASITLSVPYDAILKVEETAASAVGYTTTINGVEESEFTSRITENLTGTDAVNFVNKKGGYKLIITKAITGEMSTESEVFDFTISGLDNNCSYYIYGNDGTEKTSDLPTLDGTVLSFAIGKNEKIEIDGIQAQSMLTITEKEYTGCIMSYGVKRINSEGTTIGRDPGGTGNSFAVRMDSSKKVEITNNFPAVAPTGINTRHTPWLLLLLFGLMLLIGGGVVVKRRRGDDPDDGAVAVRPTPLGNGPLGGDIHPVTRRKDSVNTGQPTHSTTDAEDHIRWRNSVWVENNGLQRGFTPPQANVPCPQAKLWMTRTGPTGRRGDAG